MRRRLMMLLKFTLLVSTYTRFWTQEVWLPGLCSQPWCCTNSHNRYISAERMRDIPATTIHTSLCAPICMMHVTNNRLPFKIHKESKTHKTAFIQTYRANIFNIWLEEISPEKHSMWTEKRFSSPSNKTFEYNNIKVSCLNNVSDENKSWGNKLPYAMARLF